MNWALARPEAYGLLQELPEMEALGPIAGAFVGFVNLSGRQGWGVIVGFANGIWAGVLAIVMSGVLYMVIQLTQALREGLVTSFDRFLNVLGAAVEPLIDQLAGVQLLIVSLGAAAIVGVVTEFLHWLLVKFRGKRHRST